MTFRFVRAHFISFCLGGRIFNTGRLSRRGVCIRCLQSDFFFKIIICFFHFCEGALVKLMHLAIRPEVKEDVDCSKNRAKRLVHWVCDFPLGGEGSCHGSSAAFNNLSISLPCPVLGGIKKTYDRTFSTFTGATFFCPSHFSFMCVCGHSCPVKAYDKKLANVLKERAHRISCSVYIFCMCIYIYVYSWAVYFWLAQLNLMLQL